MENKTVPAKPQRKCWMCDKPFEYYLTDDVEAAHKACTILGQKRPEAFWRMVPHDLCLKKEEEEAQMKQRAHLEEGRLKYIQQLYFIDFLPANAAQKTFEAFKRGDEDSKSFDLVSAWHPQDPFGIFFMGAPGSGKTHLMLSLFNRLVNDQHFSQNRGSVTWFPVASGLDQIRSELQSSDDKFKQKAMRSHYLFLDDLGVENATDWGREQLYIILDYRLSQGLTTFTSTNLTADEVRTRYHERFLSRIKESSIVIQLKAADHRSNKMKENLEVLKRRLHEVKP